MDKQLMIWQSQLFSLQVQLQGMIAENAYWLSQNDGPTYREEAFTFIQQQAETLTENIMHDKI